MAEPHIAEADFTLHLGEALAVLEELPEASVDCIITSPPYWNLRDYGTGDEQLGLEPVHDCAGWATGAPCGACYVCKLTAILRECRRVLAPHGTLWLNLGDSYASKARGSDNGWDKSRLDNPGAAQKAQAASLRQNGERHRGKAAGLKEKDLVGIPWRVALALQADGWWLRNDNIWTKNNPMPESVKSRATVAHEYVFMLARSARYWYDGEAVKERVSEGTHGGGVGGGNPDRRDGGAAINGRGRPCNVGRNARTVWRINTDPYRGAHFATFPQALVRRALLAGCPREVCTICGAPRERIVEKGEPVLQADTWTATGAAAYDAEADGYVRSEASTLKHVVPTKTVGWTDCGHNAYRPGRVLDPFVGSGTVAVVARQEGRHAVGIELNPAYVPLIRERLAAWVTGRPAPAPEPDPDQLSLIE